MALYMARIAMASTLKTSSPLRMKCGQICTGKTAMGKAAHCVCGWPLYKTEQQGCTLKRCCRPVAMGNTALTEAQLRACAAGKGHGWSGVERSLAAHVIRMEAALHSAQFAIQVALDGGAVSETNVRSTLEQIDAALAPRKKRKACADGYHVYHLVSLGENGTDEGALYRCKDCGSTDPEGDSAKCEFASAKYPV